MTSNDVVTSTFADTFVRDVPFSVVEDAPEGEETFGDETVRVVLSR